MPRMYKHLLFVVAFLLTAHSLLAQTPVTLSGTSYTETFDGIGTSVPTGWVTYLSATTATLGTSTSYATAPTPWTTVTGNFRNVASGDIGLTATTAQQNAATDRAWAVRQTGAVGDPGASFAVQLANTSGLQSFSLSLKLQSLDAGSGRTTIWSVQYGIGSSPTTFNTIATQPIGGSAVANNTITYNFGTALDNITQPVWIRVVALTGSSGSGNRPTTGLDDFTLNYTSLTNNPVLGVSPTSLSAMTYSQGAGPSAPGTFTVTARNLTPANSVTITPSTSFEVSTDNTTYSTNPLALTPASDGSLTQTIYTRLVAGLTASTYSGTVTVTSPDIATPSSVSLSGQVYPAGAVGPCGTSTSISAIRAAADNLTFTATGRVTSSIGTNIYIQDATGGILLYTGTGTTVDLPELSIGDEIQVTGLLSTYNTDREMKNFTGCFVKTTTPNATPAATAVTTATLCNHKGELVALPNVSIVSPSGTTFAGNTNYTLSDGTVLRIQNGTDLVNATRPTGTFSVTGVVSLFNGVCQLLPRFTADIPGSTPTTAACPEVGTGGTTIATDNTLDITWWNVEWLGNTGYGPTNEAQQQDNVRQQLQNLNQDIYCLEEVTDLNVLKNIVTALNTNLGKSYTYTCGEVAGRTPPIYYSHWFDIPEVPGDATTYAQKVCFIYNTALVSNVSASQILTIPGATSNWASARFPLLMSADVTINGVTKNLKMVGLHAKSGSDASSYSRRIADYTSLKNYLDATYPTDNVLIMGDYNDDADQSIYLDATSSTTNVSSFNNFVTSPDYTVITKQLSNCNIASTASYSDIIDHLTVSNEISTNGSTNASGISYIVNSVKVNRPIIGGTNTSDHFPVSARFVFSSPVTTTLVASASAVCAGQPVNLSITVGGLTTGQTYSYTVSNGTNSTTTAGVSTTSTQASVVPTVPGSFTVTVLTSTSATATAVSGSVAINTPLSGSVSVSSTTALVGTAVTLTATGGSAYQWSASSGVNLSSPTTASVVSATFTSPGNKTFTVVVTDGVCSQTLSTTVAASYEFVDLTPTVFIENLSFSSSDAGVTRDFIVNINEVSNKPSNGVIAFKIAKPTAFVITYSTADGTSQVRGGLSNTNSSWTFSEDDNYITVQTSAAFTGFGNKIVGFSITRKPGIPANTMQSLNVTILPSAGSEQNFANNVAVTSITAN